MKPAIDLSLLALAAAVGAFTAFTTFAAHAAPREANERLVQAARDRASPEGAAPAASPPAAASLAAGTTAAGAVKTLNFNLAALPPAGSPYGCNQPPSGPVIHSPTPPANPAGNGLSLLADGDFSFSVQDDTSVLDASQEFACRDGGNTSDRKGMTWGVYPDHPVSGVTTVSCQGAPGGNCNAYVGDTPGSTAVPVLCVFPANQPNANFWQ